MTVTEYLAIQADFKETEKLLRSKSEILNQITRAVAETNRNYVKTINIHFINTDSSVPLVTAMKESFHNKPIDANEWASPDEWQDLINSWHAKRATRDEAWEKLEIEHKRELVDPTR